VGDDFPLAQMWAHGRAVHIMDDPDEVHKRAIAQSTLRRYTHF